MDNLTEKISKITDLSTYTDITPENLKKVFAEIGGSPEKLRTILNFLFVPDLKPTFVEPHNDTANGLYDIEFLDAPDTEGPQRPMRLIDLETGNLVDSWNTSPLDSYCMLSHRWKGDEVTLAHIKRAREKHMERTRSGLTETRNENSGDLSGKDNDTHLLLEQCKEDILEQEQNILALSRYISEDANVEDLLERRLRANEARGKMNWAQQNLDVKKAKTERSRIEQKMFDQIIQRVNEEVVEAAEEAQDTEDSAQESPGLPDPGSTPKSNPQTSALVAEADEEYANAQKLLNLSVDNQNAAQPDIDFFRSNNRLGYAVDEMLSRLQRWKSATKLINAISEARRIFARKNFPSRGARYIWSDTCCIDKLNYGELSQSLSLMGDWYANAEFCLVHLDTDWRASDAVRDWRAFKCENVEQTTVNIESFESISGSAPEWANRAWTLQELVMSKMCYFVNSSWQPLCRPVESLGYLYPILPLVELYTRGGSANRLINRTDTLEAQCAILREITNSEAISSCLETDDVEISNGDQAASESIRQAIRLIRILQSMDFKFPTEMATETATPEMTRAVYLAAWKLARDDEDDLQRTGRDILQELKDDRLSVWLESKNLGPEQQAQEIINFLLACLVLETNNLVVTDREYIATFGQVSQLDSWKRGVARHGFPAQQVLQLSSRRKATVAVDHVYSLMGVLGVRCPTFHAEGYPRALARLLDEVIVNQNDVSVFNWTGVEMGSPVRGRSLYPASHRAYATDEDKGRKYNILIAAETHKKRNEVMGTYHGIIKMLQETIECVKTKGRKGIPLQWVREICAFIRGSTFDQLRPELESLGRILLYIKDSCSEPLDPPQKAEEPQKPETSPSPPVPEEKSGWGFNVKPSLAGVKVPSGIKAPKVPSFGISKPSFGRHQSEPVAKTELDKSEPKSDNATAAPKQLNWLSLDSEVMQYLKGLSSPSEVQRLPLPEGIVNLELKAPEPEGLMSPRGDDVRDDFGGFTCPNPIIVNNSGIDGIFDIQRIVVTMLDRDKLLRQVARASSPKQQISGWCTLSTGFASVAVNFACEQHILKKQLDIEMTVEDKIIKAKRASKLYNDFEVRRSARTSEQPNNPTDGAEKDKDKEDTGKNSSSSKPTKEEQEIVRIIDFIQEPKLQLVAGEWVLSRFSGVPNAKWFLCSLELGSTHQFYGRRIATSDIDFANSAVEPGLVTAWQTYMARKKRKMCGILNTYINSFESAAKSEEKLRVTSEIATQGRGRIIDMGNQSLERVASMRSGLSTSSTKPSLTEPDEDAKNQSLQDSEDEETEFLDDLLDYGKKASLALGEYTVLAAYEKISERYARHLDKYLATSVLKKTPKSLQAAVESVDANRNFLPAMFHSSRNVHMF